MVTALFEFCILVCLLFSTFATAFPSTRSVISTQRKFISQSFPSSKVSSITQVKNPKWTSKQVSTLDVYAAPFLKHRIPLPKDLATAIENRPSARDLGKMSPLERRANGQTVSGSNGQFVFPVRVGTPGQTLYLIFDTGSGDFWVWSWQMPRSLLQNHRASGYYNASLSSTAVQFTGQSFNIGYASGSVYGNVWLDTVYVDGDGVQIGVGDQPVECAQNVGGSFSSLPAVDGIMGLNTWVYDQESPNPQQTWLDFILSPGHLAAQVFTVALVRDGVGTMDFGYIDTNKYTGSIAYAPVRTVPNAPATGYWSFFWSGFAIGSRAYNTTSIPVLTDTGTNVVLLPQSIIKKYYADVAGAYQQSDGSWCFPCKSILPPFTFGIGQVKVVVPSKSFIFAELGLDKVNCYGALQATSESQFALFGTPFMNALFVVHDYGGNRLGFATRTKT
ncbi:aspartic peptidase domain-containing protein [Bisporella sp. PMI_857]|nr:aspartic peptidase domain-containing protein [Bisporella sp. PMI_857]